MRHSGDVPFLKPWFERRTWLELAYCVIGFPVAVVGFVFAVTLTSLSAGLAITFIGLPLLAFTLYIARGWGATYRALGRGMLGIEVAAPPSRRGRGRAWRHITDKTSWRAMLFLIVRLPVSIIDLTVAVAFSGYGLGALTYWFWRPFLPRQKVDGVYHRGANFGTHYFLDTPGRVAVVAAVGAMMLLLAPWLIRAVTAMDRALIRGLLAPTAADRRVQQLEQTRAMAVDDAATSLRRIERDLHDGAQARLVALAMSLGLAKEELDTDDPAALNRIRSLIDAAHREAKGTIVDLRDLAKGIHPPALDRGLQEALATLSSRSPVPVSLDVSLPDRPSPAIESIVYFCTAELLTNIAKHSGARHASVSVIRGAHRLLLRVDDDGAGGASLNGRSGTGIAGLVDRVATVDGKLDVMSPEGGPTTVTVEIPV